ncbi:MAG: ATP-binding protein, partial [Spirochaetaceae bacterium]|nr:ATP-binding protein [Spirochaetaceae bacterium]
MNGINGIPQRFVDRAGELAFLEEQWKQDRASFVVVYGRRRIGKTALLSHFLSGRRGFYFLATEESEAQNRAAFRALASQFSGNKLLAASTTAYWDLIFRETLGSSRRSSGSTRQDRLIIAIDEFQYLAKANPAFPSILQKIWDSFLSGKNIMLILCGSSISMMESSVLS